MCGFAIKACCVFAESNFATKLTPVMAALVAAISVGEALSDRDGRHKACHDMSLPPSKRRLL
jgi:hypothetical protein